jgi:RNA polymerase sigma-70 factor (ECF subfamily)
MELVIAAETGGPNDATAMAKRTFDYDVLVRPLESRMMRSIWRIVRQREAAEDALQDALAAVWKKRDRIADHPNPQALILRIAVTKALDSMRKSRRRLRHEIPGLPEQPADEAASPVTRGSEDRGLRAEIIAAIGRLPGRQATAVLLRIVEVQSYEDIARAMGCSETTVRVHVRRARAALTRRLAGYRPGRGAGSGRGGKEMPS